MKTYRDVGIIFKKTNLNEADTIISLLTKFRGRVDAIAKGVRKTSSRKSGNIDLFHEIKFSCAKGKNLDVITEVELINPYDQLKKNLTDTFLLFYIAEMLDTLLHVGEKQRDVFLLIKSLLKILSEQKSTVVIFAYIIHLLKILGYQLHATHCLECNRELQQNESRFVSFNGVGFSCDKEKIHNGIEVSDASIKVIKYISRNSLQKALQLDVDRTILKELHVITKQWIENIVEKELKSAQYVIT